MVGTSGIREVRDQQAIGLQVSYDFTGTHTITLNLTCG
jgi:hypothetical protein